MENIKIVEKGSFLEVNKRLIAFTSFCGMLIIGMSFSITSPILIEISNTLGKSLSITAVIFAFFYAGYTFGPFVSKFLYRIVQRKIAIGVIFFIQTAFIFIFSFTHSLYFAFFVYFLIGLCAGFEDTALSTLLAEINPGKEGFFMNMSHVFVSLGAFAGPYISSLTVNSSLAWQTSFYFLSAFCLLNLVVFIFIKVPNTEEFDNRIKEPHGSSLDKTKQPLLGNYYIYSIVFLAVAIFLYTFSESGLNVWTPTFLRLTKSFSQLNSSQVLSFFWLAVTIGRLIMSLISTKVNLSKLTIAISILGTACVILGIFSNRVLVCTVAFSAAGLFYSGVFPNILAIASINFKDRQDTAISILITCTGAGTLLASQFVGIAYRFFDLNEAFFVIGILPLVVALLIFCFSKVKCCEVKSIK